MNRIPMTITLYEQVLPVDRGERYEDPLTQLLEQEDIGEVTVCATSPLCAGAQIVVRCGHADGQPRSFRLPERR